MHQSVLTSRRRASASPSSAVSAMRASGSTTASSRSPVASTPSAIHWVHARLSKALWSELVKPAIGILQSEATERFDERRSVPWRGVVREAPAGGGQEFVLIRIELLQILQMPAPRSLVGGGVELEADHVEPARQPGDEPAVVSSFEAAKEAGRQTKVEQRLGAKVDPVVRESVGARHPESPREAVRASAASARPRWPSTRREGRYPSWSVV